MNSSREKKGFFSNKSPMIMFIYIVSFIDKIEIINL